MKKIITITAQRLFGVVERRSLFGRKEYLQMTAAKATVSVFIGSQSVCTVHFSGKLGGFHHTSPYRRVVECEVPDDDNGLSVFAESSGVFTYRFDMANAP